MTNIFKILCMGIFRVTNHFETAVDRCNIGARLAVWSTTEEHDWQVRRATRENSARTVHTVYLSIPTVVDYYTYSTSSYSTYCTMR
jgi:hypothetical protein